MSSIITEHSRFTRALWNTVEAPISTQEKELLRVLVAAGKGHGDNVPITFQSCGHAYLAIRSKLCDSFPFYVEVIESFVPTPKGSKKGGKSRKHSSKAGVSKEEVAYKATVKKLTTFVTDLEKVFKDSDVPSREATCPVRNLLMKAMGVANSVHFMEAQPIVIMRFIAYVLKSINSRDDDEVRAEAYELCIAAQTISQELHTLHNKVGSAEEIVNQFFLQDFDQMITLLSKRFSFSYRSLFSDFPQYTQNTCYSKYYKSKVICLYPSQREITDIVIANVPTLALYNSNISGGKTMTSVSAAAACADKGVQLLFVCCSNPVRMTVAKMFHHSGTKFAIATTSTRKVLPNKKREDDNRPSKVTAVVKSFNCGDAAPTAIVCDLLSAITILKKSTEHPDILSHCMGNYVLFLDEPTAYADEGKNAVTRSIAEILAHAPPITILASATMPPTQELKPIIDHILESNNATLRETGHMETSIGCDLKCGDKIFIPFEQCNTAEELKTFISQIQSTKFVDRLLPPQIAFHVEDAIKQHAPDHSLPFSLESFFADNINNLKQTAVQKAVLQLLESCLTLPDAIISKITTQGNFDFDSVVPLLDTPIFTTDSYKYQGTTLIACSSPLDTALTLFTRSFPTENVDSISTILKDFQKKKDARDKAAAKIADKFGDKSYSDSVSGDHFNDSYGKSSTSTTGNKKSKPVGKKSSSSNGGTNRREHIDPDQRIDNLAQANIKFKESYQINTTSHFKTHHPKLEASSRRTALMLEHIPTDLSIDARIYFLLFCGVAVYDRERISCPLYNNLILEMASKGELAMMISDKAMCFGVELPFSNIIIDDTFAKSLSILTLFQLMGRAGRSGSSWVSNVFVDKDTYHRIHRYIIAPHEEVQVEGMNLVASFNDIDMEYEDDDEEF